MGVCTRKFLISLLLGFGISLNVLGEGVFGQDLNQAFPSARRSGRPVMIDFFSPTCGPCITLENEIYNSSAFASSSKRFELVKINVDDPNQRLLKVRYQVGPTPTIIFADSDGREMTRIVGLPTADQLFETMDWVAAAGKRKAPPVRVDDRTESSPPKRFRKVPPGDEFLPQPPPQPEGVQPTNELLPAENPRVDIMDPPQARPPATKAPMAIKEPTDSKMVDKKEERFRTLVSEISGGKTGDRRSIDECFSLAERVSRSALAEVLKLPIQSDYPPGFYSVIVRAKVMEFENLDTQDSDYEQKAKIVVSGLLRAVEFEEALKGGLDVNAQDALDESSFIAGWLYDRRVRERRYGTELVDWFDDRWSQMHSHPPNPGTICYIYQITSRGLSDYKGMVKNSGVYRGSEVGEKGEYLGGLSRGLIFERKGEQTNFVGTVKNGRIYSHPGKAEPGEGRYMGKVSESAIFLAGGGAGPEPFIGRVEGNCRDDQSAAGAFLLLFGVENIAPTT